MALSTGGDEVPMVQLNSICSRVPADTQRRIATTFWGPVSPESYYIPTCCIEPYFVYYTEQCRTMYHSFGTSLSFATHEAVMELVRDMRQGWTREQLVRGVLSRHAIAPSSTQFDESDVVNAVVNLAARLLLMVDVGKPAANRIWTGRTCQSWNQGSIRNFTAAIFPVQAQRRPEGVELDTDFNARNLDVIAGLRVELTNNLLDHLQLVDIEGVSTVTIFHHASFLQNQEEPPFPDGFVHETLQTLALLFPQNKWYGDSKAWYHKHLEPTASDADQGVMSCGPLTMTSLDAYRFWHDRLVRLKQTLDQAKPRTLRQWWNDRREGTQWYALWVAVGMAVFFGLVQSIEGALQVYKAYHAD